VATVTARSIASALAAALGDGVVSTDPDVNRSYEVDWTGRFHGRSACVARPRTSDEVAALVRWAVEHQCPLVPQGGNTGLVGGGVPDASGSSVLVSVGRMSAVRDVDIVAGQATVEAGVTLGALDRALAGEAWEFGVDLGARDSATLGGMAATNAGGLRVLRYGSMRANVLGVEAVLGTGQVVSHLQGLVKDNTGYDLAGLLCGSEGTLGVITALRLRLVPRWPDRLAVWLACDDWSHAVDVATTARLSVDGLDGLEAVDSAALRHVQEQLGLPSLFDTIPPVALLVAWAGRGEPPDALGMLVGDHAHVAGVDAAQWRSLWAYRERVTEAVARVGVPRKFDVTLPLRDLAEFTRRIALEPAAHGAVVFGHLGDGNLHVNLPGQGEQSTGDDVDGRILGLVADCGGSISAEHGIGRHKAPWLHLNRSPEELAAFRSLKAALDPTGIMNPGVILPA